MHLRESTRRGCVQQLPTARQSVACDERVTVASAHREKSKLQNTQDRAWLPRTECIERLAGEHDERKEGIARDTKMACKKSNKKKANELFQRPCSELPLAVLQSFGAYTK